MRQLWSDLRVAWRSLSKVPSFTAAVIATLALGITLEASVIAVVNAYLIRSLPYPAARRLYNVRYSRPGEYPPTGLAELEWDAVGDVVEQPVSWDLDYFYLIGGGHPEAVPGAWVTRGFMLGLGIAPALGRSFGAEEYAPGGPQVALIGHGLWQGRFGGDSAVIGRSFEAYVSDRPDDPELFTIVGVLPADFWHLNPYTQVLTPLRAPSYPYLVRLREGVPPALAERRLADLVRAGVGTLPAGWRVELRSAHDEYAGRVKPMLLAIGTSATLVLLIAGTNVAFLVLLRGMRRQREVAVRLALGAGRARIGRLLVTESLLLSIAGGALGTLAAAILLRRLGPTIELQLGRPAPGGTAALALDPWVIAALAALVLLIALGLTLAPMIVATRQSLLLAMHPGRRAGTETSRGRRTRASLIGLQVAGSLALLAGSGLMLRTLIGMLDVDLGMRSAGVVTANLALRDRRYPDGESRATFYERLLAALGPMPGIAAAALSLPPPLAELPPEPVHGEDGAAATSAGVFAVTPDFFATLGIPIRQGRSLGPPDRGAGEPVALVSESFARRLWPGASPLGKRVRVRLRWLDGADTAGVVRTVVGVVGDVRHSPTDRETADVYVPLLQAPGRFARLMMRTAAGPGTSWLDASRRALEEIDPEASLYLPRELDELVDEQLARPRFLASLLVAFGLFATVLALIGVYGVIGYAVEQRRHEVAVRLAIGADGRSIVRLFLREGGAVLSAGVVVGLGGAIVLGRVLQSQLYGVRPFDPVTLLAAALTLTGAGLVAVWWPARRASATDPAVVLREE
jgi:predicted permease